MRLAVVNWSSRKVGGTETYLGDIMGRLHGRGLELSFFCEVEQPRSREPISLPDGIPTWCVERLGAKRALAALREWQPDLIFSHGMRDTRVEARINEIAPSVLFAHTYYGTCISGEKTFKSPVARPCTLNFGPQCLWHYYPHRCGGLSPITMLRLYRTQVRRLSNVRNYSAIVTHSSHMRAEFVRHGYDPKRIHNILYYSNSDKFGPQRASVSKDCPAPAEKFAPDNLLESDRQSPAHLLFLGRMSFLKGGQTLLAAAALASNLLQRPVHLTFAGDGPDRHKWEKQAARVRAEHSDVTFEFTGWIAGAEIDRIFAQADLLVFPSLWPEPFGLIGLEAGHRGVPIAAFAVGGIPEWLFEGVNGHLAPGDPPTAQGLAEAIVKCLRDPAAYAQLRRGAVEVANEFSMSSHLATLLRVFEQVVAGSV